MPESVDARCAVAGRLPAVRQPCSSPAALAADSARANHHAFPTRPSPPPRNCASRRWPATWAIAITESLTTEVGPRLAGSEADARAVQWAQAKFKALGFDKVWTEPVRFPKWERRSEHARRCSARQSRSRCTLTALGGSPGGTVEAEVVRFADLAALEAAARRFARRQDRLHRLPHGTRARRRRLRPGRQGAQPRSVGGDPRRRGGVPDAFGRHRFAPQSAHRHHPLRRRPHADSVGRAGRARRRPARAPARARPGARARGAGLRLGRRSDFAQRDRRDPRQRASPRKWC